MRLKILCLCLLLALLLCACGQTTEQGSTRTVTVGGTAYVIDDTAGTISDGKYIYRYSVQPYSGGYHLTIPYPDGSKWWWKQDGSFGSGGRSDSFDSRNPELPDGFTLRDVLETQMPRSGGGGGTNPLLAILILAVGLLNTFAPQVMWNLRYGWHYKDAEPSELSLGVGRAIGIVCLVIGVILLAAAIF